MLKALSENHHHTALDSLFRYAELLNFGEVHIKVDHVTGLRAIIAIHNLKRGPAIGGCRMIEYPSADAALEDALRLSYMMSYKAAISNLPHGGAKAVLIKPKVIKDRTAYFEAFGDFVNTLNGNYITAVDSGTNPADMDIIAKRTRSVVSTTAQGGDPSPQTALGIYRAIEAAVKFKLNRDTVENIHVAIQGAGHVGYHLAKNLHANGARITMCDVNPIALQRCVDEFNAKTCSTELIYDLEVDVFSPCALGAILNLETINRLRTKIVAGSANNQLAHHQYGTVMHERGILYAPDFVINAGGLIYVAAIYDHSNPTKAFEQVGNIYQTCLMIFEKSKKENCATNEIAEAVAREMLR